MSEIYQNAKVNSSVHHEKNSALNLNLESSLCFPKEIFYAVKHI